MQTIITFLIYFALTSLLHYWVNRPYKWKTVMDARVRPEHIVKGIDTSEFKVGNWVYMDGELTLTNVKPVFQHGIETLKDGKVVSQKRLHNSKEHTKNERGE